MIKAVVSDFGGVVTLPLDEAFTRAHEEIGIPLDALRKAMALLASRYAASRRCSSSSAAR